MRFNQIIVESAATELAKRLPSLQKHDYNTIDQLMRTIAAKHKISGHALHNLFVKKFHKTPDSWIKGRLDEEGLKELDIADEVRQFGQWAKRVLHIKGSPKIVLSYDTEEAQTNHHTGRHIDGEDTMWVYVNNRNLVDILRTVFHELVHYRQGEIGMIKPNSSYPGSPIEVMADALAGKYIKIYGEKHHKIFQ